MNPVSARTLNAFILLMILLALVMLSPVAAFALLVASALLAAVPATFARQRPRVLALVLLALSLGLAAAYYPAFRRAQRAYRTHAERGRLSGLGVLGGQAGLRA